MAAESDSDESRFPQCKPPLYPQYSNRLVKIFLAGSIEMGKAKNWQQGVVERLNKDFWSRWNIGQIYNPRRDDWDASWAQDIGNDRFKGQVTWELDHIDKADIVFFYFQGQTLSPISLLELGIALAAGKKVVVYCDIDYWRKANIDVTCIRYRVNVHSDYEVAISELKSMIREKMEEAGITG